MLVNLQLLFMPIADALTAMSERMNDGRAALSATSDCFGAERGDYRANSQRPLRVDIVEKVGISQSIADFVK
jgi:hypothetical protein